MNRMKLHGMAEAFRESLAGTTPQSMTADTFLSMPSFAREWDYRAQAAIARLTKMRHSATRLILSRLTMPRTGDWTATRWNVSPPLILCIRHRTFSLLVLPEREKLFGLCPLDTKHAKGDSVPSMPMPETARCAESRQSKRYTRNGTQEDWALPVTHSWRLVHCTLDAKERPILLEIIEDRHERKSVIITSQYPSSNWYDMVGDPTIADAILDRIIHTAHTIELYGESMRKLKSRKREFLKGKIILPQHWVLKGQSYSTKGGQICFIAAKI